MLIYIIIVFASGACVRVFNFTAKFQENLYKSDKI